jgi:hypothetical protein
MFGIVYFVTSSVVLLCLRRPIHARPCVLGSGLWVALKMPKTFKG